LPVNHGPDRRLRLGRQLGFCDIHDAQAIARVVPLMTDRKSILPSRFATLGSSEAWRLAPSAPGPGASCRRRGQLTDSGHRRRPPSLRPTAGARPGPMNKRSESRRTSVPACPGGILGRLGGNEHSGFGGSGGHWLQVTRWAKLCAVESSLVQVVVHCLTCGSWSEAQPRWSLTPRTCVPRARIFWVVGDRLEARPTGGLCCASGLNRPSDLSGGCAAAFGLLHWGT